VIGARLIAGASRTNGAIVHGAEVACAVCRLQQRTHFDAERAERFSFCVRRTQKAAVNAPHSKRLARFEDARQSRSVWSAGVFSTAFRERSKSSGVNFC